MVLGENSDSDFFMEWLRLDRDPHGQDAPQFAMGVFVDAPKPFKRNEMK